MKIPYRTNSKLIDLEAIAIDDIEIEDIAHGLSQINRYNGATFRPYSVAEHSILTSMLVSPRYQLAALMHDAHEYIIGDIASPVAKMIGSEIVEIAKNRLDLLICEKFQIPWIRMHSTTIRTADAAMLQLEMDHFWGEQGRTVIDNICMIRESLDSPLEPYQYNKLFIEKFNEYKEMQNGF